MNNVLEWIKANLFVVVFGVIMIAAAVALPLLSSRMNNKVRATVNQRVQLLSQLSQLQRGEIIPGHPGLPNDRTLQEYERNAQMLGDDAAAVQQTAIAHNRKDREPLQPIVRGQRVSIFPVAPAADIQVIPFPFHEALVDAYGSLLHSVRAGMPPTLEDLRKELEATHVQFITQDLRKALDEKLTEEEEKQLSEKLSNVRMSLYVEAAKQVGMYVSMDALGVPQWSQASQPSHGELFTWQWQYWVIEDILKALHAANHSDSAVLDVPVKHVVFVNVINVPIPNQTSGAGGAPAIGDARSAAGMGDQDAPPGPAGRIGTEPNPKVPVQPNYTVSFTGRVTNPLYDVISAQLILIVDTRRLPEVLDAIASYNFMTVTSMSLKQVDQFEAAQSGYFYGSEPVAQVEMTIETVWLRTWTRDFMPDEIKRALGIPQQPVQGQGTDA